MTIRTKLLVTYVALTGTMMALLTVILLSSFYNYFLDTTTRDLSARAELLSENVEDLLQNRSLEAVVDYVAEHAGQDGINLTVLNAEGELIASNIPLEKRENVQWKDVPGISMALLSTANSGVSKGVANDQARVYRNHPLRHKGKVLGVLRISLTMVEFERQFATMLSKFAGSFLLAFALSAIVSLWLARSIGRPIQEMRNFAVLLGTGNFGGRLSTARSDELGDLATELNRMSERLESLETERRSFLANVSHELRTPVSNVHVTLEALESGADQEPELRARFLQTAREETARLARLIADLLDLGRLEAGVALLEKQELNLQRLMQSCVRAMETRMLSKGIAAELEVPSLPIVGDRERLLQAFFNIFDNAVKFSATNTQIRITGRLHDGFCCVDIQDEGPGIQESDVTHVFDKFFTGDRSRKRGGTGLGLAMARRIIEAHAGRITVQSTVGVGTTLTVSLPAA